jgi:hypothetical protein
MAADRAPRRGLRRLAVVFGFGLLLAFVPVPTLRFEEVPVGAVNDLPAPAPAAAAEVAAVQSVADEPVGEDRVSAADPAVAEFSTIGLRFDRAPEQPVFVRVSSGSGDLGEWRELHPEGGPDAGTAEAEAASGVATEPFWVGEASGFEVNLGAADARSAEVITVHDELRRAVSDATPLAGAGVDPPFGIGSRASWGARAAKAAPGYASAVSLGVVHHSVNSNSYSAADVPGMLRSIQAFHMDGNGWDDIGYNFAVDKFGGVWEARGGGIDRPVRGAHAVGFNTGSVGVVVLGDYSATNPSSASIESVSRVIGWKLALHGNDPAGTVAFTSGGSDKYPAGTVVNLPRVVGHRDTSSTSCPGNIQGFLGQIRTRSQEWTNWVRAVSYPEGLLEGVWAAPGRVSAGGFALDPDIGAPARIHLSVAGRTVEVFTGIPRPDIQAQWPRYGPNSGFSAVADGVPPGWQRACVTIINQGQGLGDKLLGCRDVIVPDPAGNAPTGSITGLSARVGGFEVTGRASDPNSSSPVTVDVQLNGVTVRSVTVGPGAPFSADVQGVVGGSRLLCLRVRNLGPGIDTAVDCRDLTVPWSPPRGAVEGLRRVGDELQLWGWAVDDETLDPTFVIVIVNGRWTIVWADRPKPGWESAFPRLGANHGFEARIPVSGGAQDVCVVARNVGGGQDATLACRVVK